MSFATGLLRKLPPHFAHRMALRTLKYDLLPHAAVHHDCLRTSLWGLDFDNPVGISAGFDKDAEAVGGLFGMGFGFVETGTVTPKPQRGNPAPNLFRLAEDEALINWLGFPSRGLDVFGRRFEKAAAHAAGPLGANIGINTGTDDAVRDIAGCAERLAPFADYLVVNVSCPNTPGLLEWQTPEGVRRILSATREACGRAGKTPPVLVKLSPDIAPEKLEAVLGAAFDTGVAGLIVSNTTVVRPDTLRSANAGEQGGLSGPPLASLSLDLLRRVYDMTDGRVPLIASGGIATAHDAYTRIRAGASLVQIYTALVYRGPRLAVEMIDGLADLLKADGFASIAQAVGADKR